MNSEFPKNQLKKQLNPCARKKWKTPQFDILCVFLIKLLGADRIWLFLCNQWIILCNHWAMCRK